MFHLPTFAKSAIDVIASRALAPAFAFGLETGYGKPGYAGERSLIYD